MNEKTKFIKWFVRPFNRLKDIEYGDGSFVILSMGIFLCERYYRIKSNCVKPDSIPDKFYVTAAKDFGVDVPVFERFWAIYRHGMQHRGQPQKWIKEWNDTRTKKVERRYGWAIDAKFSHKPTMCKIGNRKIVCINPTKFTEFVLKRFLSKPEYLRRSVHHQFGDIFPLPKNCKCE